ncbi:hypothetical protein [Mycolicibacterium hippocampi]|uniref:Uncharacterized protein n=1 Tax=Mycolicibacterium hippocampi TaxID=659824 RepID=A0A7I9ZIX0_9MYCO|nr:hypothetical protein [Mycolicibacterium hippocampi]GFH00796.1 hypothetical protein MHIP_12790 [Mycolicibacterium hippocampi]
MTIFGTGRNGVRERGLQIFVDVLAEFAARVRVPGVTAVQERCGAPLAVAVRGRGGVGRGAVAAALADSGVTIATDTVGADVQVLVIAEALKPEDRSAAAVPTPTLVVLNKADLTGAGRPLDAAERIAAQVAATVGLTVVPMIAHLASVELDDDDVAALRTLVTHPADMTSTDAFVQSQHPLPATVRRQLLARLDRFGLAHAVLALADGASTATVTRQLRALSQVDRVVEHLDGLAAPIRYRRVCAAVHELQLLAARSGDRRLEVFLTSDEIVIAVMAAAVEVVQACGAAVDRGHDADAHMRRARHWRRYSRGPVDLLHQRCAADIARGSLRLLGQTR